MITILIFIRIVILIIILLQYISIIVSEKQNNYFREEIIPYECGFELRREIRVPFSLIYFILTLIFLLFDLEIIFLVFLPIQYIDLILFKTIIFVLRFLLILIISLLYEWNIGNLNW